MMHHAADAGTKPLIITRGEDIRARVERTHATGQTVGLVPTMGALHAGHLSLVERSRRECRRTVVSIFVNPAQFGPAEDFQRYPRTLAGDIAQLERLGVDLVFAPEAAEMYPPGHATWVEVPSLSERWEGACRPGHFRGVATVVLKLFQLIPADVAYFGQKDFQQTLVVRRMAADLHLPIRISVCPTVREPDGLALSSRNAYLSSPERSKALAMSRSLRRGAELVAGGERDAARIHAAMMDILRQEPEVRLDYLAIVNRETLDDLPIVDRPAVALIAANVGGTRLIDNTLLEG